MKNRVSFSRAITWPCVLLLVSASSRSAAAQSASFVGAGAGHEPGAGMHSSNGSAFTFEGTVLAPDGTPAAGSVVVSTAGGQARTDARGKFRLAARVPVLAESVQVTAVGGAGGTLIASQRITLAAPPGNLAVAPLQLAQSSTCVPSWLPTFGSTPGADNDVLTLAVFNDGSGAALYAAGRFVFAGGVFAQHIAKWDGSSWKALGSGLDGTAHALAVFDDGSGEALCVGGDFTTAGGVAVNYVAKWDGANWSALGLGMGDTVFSLAVFDDGSGAGLYAGSVLAPGGSATRVISRWDGLSWTALGGGVSGSVLALTVFDDGAGPELFVGGNFGFAGSVLALNIAKWNGSNWSALGLGVNGPVHALTVFHGGGGAALIAGGEFTTAGGVAANRVANWDGSNWGALGAGLDGPVTALEVFDDGSGAALFAGGGFTAAGGSGASSIAKWNGASWTTVGSGVDSDVFTMIVFNDGGGDALVVGGEFSSAGGVGVNRIAQWNGSSWAAFGSGSSGSVFALAVFDDGSGDALYAGGLFASAGGVTTNNIAKWNGTSWSPLGSGTGGINSGRVEALVVFDDGGGDALYAGGWFDTAGGATAHHVAKWDGSSWAPAGRGANSIVLALDVFDDGSGAALYAGGWFTTAGGAAANRVAKWNGSSWTALGIGVDNIVDALTVFDDGGGEALFVGGGFTHAGGAPASHVAKWDGSSWTPLGSGVSGTTNIARVHALIVHDDGGGPALFVGGMLMTAGGGPANQIAKWNGSNWAQLGSGLGSGLSFDSVDALAVFDDGRGAALYAGGTFTSAGGNVALRIAKWDGSNWAALGSGVNSTVQALVAFDHGGGEALYVGGRFTSAIDSGDSFLAKWGCPTELTSDVCNGDGGDQLGCTDCPCANNAAPGNLGGCLNSVLTSSRLIASGSLSVSLPANSSDDLCFTLTGAPPTAFCTLTSGDAVAPNNALNPCFGLGSGVQAMQLDGLRCAVVNTRRHGGRSADANGTVGVSTAAWGGSSNPPAGLAQAGGGYVAGQTRYFQVIHREDPLSGCMRGLNTSQAVEATFTP